MVEVRKFSAPIISLQRCTLGPLFRLFQNVLGEYPDSGAFDRGTGVEHVGRDLLDCVSMGQELRLPGRSASKT
jgi:hypothetical protein